MTALRWHVEYAIERLAELVEEDPRANVYSDILNTLHRGLEGAPKGLQAVGAKCPVCGCTAEEPHKGESGAWAEDTSDLEAFIDQRLADMQRTPRMWGDPQAVEADCFTLVEVYERFCRKGNPENVAPAGTFWQAFARKRLPKRPAPMTLHQWFTDKENGSKETRKFESAYELKHWAGVQIVEFFIAFKAELKALSSV